MVEPILLEVQQRQKDIAEYLISGIPHCLAHLVESLLYLRMPAGFHRKYPRDRAHR